MSGSIALLVCGWMLAVTAGASAVLLKRRIRETRLQANRAIHELRRPLHAMAQAGLPIGEVRGPLAELDATINGYEPAVDLELVGIGPLLEAAAERWRPSAGRAGVALICSGPGVGAVLGSEEQLGRALDNLIANAIEYTASHWAGSGATVGLGMDQSDRGIQLRVVNRLAEADYARPAALCRFLERSTPSTTRDPRRGHGLDVVRGIAKAHGGVVGFEVSAGRLIASLTIARSPRPLPELVSPHPSSRVLVA